MHRKGPLSRRCCSTAPDPGCRHPCARHRMLWPCVHHSIGPTAIPNMHRIVDKGKGSLVRRSITRDGMLHGKWRWGPARFHGAASISNKPRLYGAEATGHGAPLAPLWCTAGPGRFVQAAARSFGGRCAASCITFAGVPPFRQAPTILDRHQQAIGPPARRISGRGHPFHPPTLLAL